MVSSVPPPVPPLNGDKFVTVGVIDFVYLKSVDIVKFFSLISNLQNESEVKNSLCGTLKIFSQLKLIFKCFFILIF